MISPVYAVDLSEFENVGLKYKYIVISAGQDFQVDVVTNFQVVSHTFNETDKSLTFNVETPRGEGNEAEFYIPHGLFEDSIMVLLDGQEISSIINETDNIIYIGLTIDGEGERVIEIVETKRLDTGSHDGSNDGGCLIATAAFGSELAPQIQLLREIRDSTVLQTQSGMLFMTGFNQFYYSFSPTISDYERENTAFKEVVKLTLIPLLTSLTLLNYVDINSEQEMLGYGIGIILLNIGIYFVAPVILIVKTRKRIDISYFSKNIEQ